MQYNKANGAFVNSNKSIAEVVMIANSSGGIQNSSDITSAIISTALTPPIQMRAQSIVVTDISSQAITATGNTAALPLDSGNMLSSVVNVTAVSGTTPTLDIMLQESADNGVTWNDIYHLQRITTTGTVTVPNMLLTNTRRWRWVAGGTSPSFTLSIVTTRGTGSAPLIRNFYDRSVNPNSLGATTPTWFTAGVKTQQIFIFNGAVTTTATIWQSQVSPDGTNFTNTGSTINPGNNLTATTNPSTQSNYFRVGVQTAGSGDTLNYIHYYGIG